MNKKFLGIVLICLLFVGFLFSYRDSYLLAPKIETTKEILPVTSKQILSFQDKDLCKVVAQKLNIPLEDVFALACLADLSKEKTSAFYVKDCLPVDKKSFNEKLQFAKLQQYRICNTKSHKYHKLTCKYGIKTKEYIILPLKEIKDYEPCGYCCKNKVSTSKKKDAKISKKTSLPRPSMVFVDKYIKILLSDHTTTLKPSKNCESQICKELVKEINSAQYTIDMALYGYERIPAIDNALASAINRGVKIRLVYDVDAKGNNLYSDTMYLAKKIPLSRSDAGITGLMHDKFFIFDKSIVLTGSANLSSTDMSGFNSNSIIVIKSKSVAELYQEEFNQMYQGNFHNQKQKLPTRHDFILGESKISVYFSPKDNTVKSAILPLINSAQKYIYMPAFLITERDTVNALIQAKQRGVDIKIIIDAVSGRSTSSKHHILRDNGILVKTENYAGKLHSKSMIVDDKYLVIGSMNFSYSGNSKNDENLVVIKNSKAALFYRKYFEYLWSRIYDFWLKHDVVPESKYSIGSLSDGIDNDYDGKIDEQD